MPTTPSLLTGSCPGNCLSRRRFLAITGASTATVVLGDVFPGCVWGQNPQTPAELTTLPPMPIRRLSRLQTDVPVMFDLGGGEASHTCMLIKLGEKAGGGIGEDQDVVAFSCRCTHMGGDLEGLYNAANKVAGPCPEHLTTFDLTRHGMVVAGHATQSLPQILLDLEGDDIFAVGIVGLLYGYANNPMLGDKPDLQ